MSKSNKSTPKKVSRSTTTISQDKLEFQSSFATTSRAPSPMTSPVASQVKSSPVPSNNTVLGYIKNVSPIMINAKKSEYFTFNIQEKCKTTKALCFSPKKHKMNVERKAESGTPCKVTKYAPHAQEENVIWINACTRIDDAQETTVHFAPNDAPIDPQVCSTTNIDNIKPHQSITIRGYLMFGDAQTEEIKLNLVKKDGYLIDENG
ncbi:uncharacterized protein LOC114575520 [Exaiptasia diaphana]|uniref:Uncharacterized protein n=1 Tax=Exaiptasia diaphana TaxID=2652724 RepID=A0A913YLJ1_EXADI|nr:uncharacterized protein LOC114575520 [Exaiptasia diaphana]